MTIGEVLSTARNQAGMSVAELSERTRIRHHLIEAIESDDFAVCGGDVYARGHIRTLASSLGVDAAPLMDAFENQQPEPPAPTIREVFTAGRGRLEPRSYNWSAVMAGLLVVAVAYGGFRLASAADHRTPQRLVSRGASAVAQPSVAVPPTATGAPTAGSAVSPPVGAEIAAREVAGVEVKVFATSDPAWLSVTGTNGRQLFRGTLAKGKSKKFTDETMVTLVVGNAAAVRVLVNGKDVGKIGKRGEVVRLIYRPGDPTAKG